jgi:hypothetical protein
LTSIPQDSNGNYCGMNNSAMSTNNSYYDQSNNSYLYYFDVIRKFHLLSFQTVSSPFIFHFLILEPMLSVSICVSSCPKNTTVLSGYANAMCRPGFQPTNDITYATLVANGTCASYTYASSPILNRCAPLDSVLGILTLLNSSSSSTPAGSATTSVVTAGTSTTMQVLSGIVVTWPVVSKQKKSNNLTDLDHFFRLLRELALLFLFLLFGWGCCNSLLAFLSGSLLSFLILHSSLLHFGSTYFGSNQKPLLPEPNLEPTPLLLC